MVAPREEDVRAAVDVAGRKRDIDEFRRLVSGRAGLGEPGQGFVVRADREGAEVDENEVLLPRAHDVFRLQILVDEADLFALDFLAAVEALQDAPDLQDHLLGVSQKISSEPFVLKSVIERRAADVAEHQETLPRPQFAAV